MKTVTKKYNSTIVYAFLVALALVVRLILMSIAAHNDLFVINMFPSLLWRENVVDILSYSKNEVNRAGFSFYPPLTYYTLSLFQYSYQLFSDTFIPWTDSLRHLYEGGFQGREADYIKIVANPNLQRDIFLAKTPYLIFDIGCILLLIVYIRKKLLDKKILILWLFNPVLLYGAYIFGQFDIIPTFFILLGFLLIRKRFALGILSIGVAGAFKNYAFVFIFVLAFIYGKTLLDKIKLTIVGFIPTIIFAVPTLINNPNQAIFAVFNRILVQSKRPLKGWALYSQILHYLALVSSYFIVTILAPLFSIKDKWRLSIGVCCILILLVLTLAPKTSFHYLFWTFPLIILWFREFKISAIILVVQTISFASYKILAPELQAGLFTPLGPGFYNLPTFNQLIDQIIPYRLVSSTGFLIFFFFNFWIISTIILNLIFSTEIAKRK
ncbi:hypothetical protein HY024_03060 [Candidatus Curtissbacteria bacterium]|nr:hypothetical protein [Candidatus Curtissbacteria bacterium]